MPEPEQEQAEQDQNIVSISATQLTLSCEIFSNFGTFQIDHAS